MLPDLRAVVAATLAAIGLLVISFGLMATFRVAQNDRAGSLRADLLERSRSLLPASMAPQPILIIDEPATPDASPPVTEWTAAEEPAALVQASAIAEASPAETSEESPADVVIVPPADAPQVAALPQPAVSQPPIGGPLQAAVQAGGPEHTASSEKAAKAAAAKKARAARLARERRAAARRVAQARRAKETTAAETGWDSGWTNSFGSNNR